MHNCQAPTLTSLTEEKAIKSIREFFRDKPFVIFGTGMSCGLDARFGMPALREELTQRILPDANSPEQQLQWKQVVQSLQNGRDLESALDNVTDSALVQKLPKQKLIPL
jgi:hypothetical protein